MFKRGKVAVMAPTVANCYSSSRGKRIMMEENEECGRRGDDDHGKQRECLDKSAAMPEYQDSVNGLLVFCDLENT